MATSSSGSYKKLINSPFNVNTSAVKYTGDDKGNAAAAEQAARALKSAQFEPGYKDLLNLLFRYTAAGNFSNQTELFFSRIDRFGTSFLTPNVEHAGLTFFTRPKLPLTSGNLQQCPSLISLDTVEPMSYAFATRCWLDTKLSSPNNAAFATAIDRCRFFDRYSALNLPLSNAVIAQSGWPDPFIQTFTTTGGFFCEDQTFPIGSDRLRKTYDLNFLFKETQGSPILSMLYTWYETMACLCEGSMVAYAEDIDAQRMPYTCSIYRFLFDPSKSHITHYAKATGCFPKAPPIGALFNQSRGETNIQAAQEISIPFVANKVEYDDPRILLDFNFLMSRYRNDIAELPILRPESYNNFKGYPFVISTVKGLELAFREPIDQPYSDEQSGRMMATTRERFELSKLFYAEPTDLILPNATGSMGVSRELRKVITLPRGPETRYLYRVATKRDADGQPQLFFDPQDEYNTSLVLDNNSNGVATYMGVPVDDTLRKLMENNKVNLQNPYVGHENKPVGPYDPVGVTGEGSGLIDTVSKARSDVVLADGTDRGNRDIVDAWNDPSPTHTGQRKFSTV